MGVTNHLRVLGWSFKQDLLGYSSSITKCPWFLWRRNRDFLTRRWIKVWGCVLPVLPKQSTLEVVEISSNSSRYINKYNKKYIYIYKYYIHTCFLYIFCIHIYVYYRYINTFYCTPFLWDCCISPCQRTRQHLTQIPGSFRGNGLGCTWHI